VSELPSGLQAIVEEVLAQISGDPSIRRIRSLGGGCINNAMRVDTPQASYLLKWNLSPILGMFPAELRGLNMLRDTRAISLPEPYAASDSSGQTPAFILMEWFEAPNGKGGIDQEMLGRQLAEMHRVGRSPQEPPAYGLDHDNFIGSTPQPNGWDDDWVRFYADRRLVPQMELARKNGRLPKERASRLERLINRLSAYIGGINRSPSLLHGDLWGGNVLPGPNGPALIDPAVYYGDREAEIAFTELFGGFTEKFYHAYQHTYPLEPGYRERKDLYNLYHLLNHLNLFGESYGYQVDSILRRYS
jgi:protein-ribulosamine 3-kinase